MLPTYTVELEVEDKDGAVEPVRFEVSAVAMARYSARDRASTRAALDQQRREGLTGLPPDNPSICFASRYLLSTGDAIEVQGGRTSGEVEFVVFKQGEQLFISVGSDHCDRTIENVYGDKAKQMCPRIVSTRAWRHEDVADHWDQLRLRSWVVKDGQRSLHQDAPLAALCTIEQLVAAEPRLRADGVVLLGGTPPSLPGTETYEDEFQMELSDPLLDRSILHRYTVHTLPSDEPWRGY